MRYARHVWLGAVLLGLFGCAPGHPSRPRSLAPVDGAEVEIGPLVQSYAGISLDVLIPAEGDLPSALQSARDEAKANRLTVVDTFPVALNQLPAVVQLVSVDEEHWDHHLPGYAVSRIDPDEFERVRSSAGVIRIDARAPAARGWELIQIVTSIARSVAGSQHGWIYDSYRAQLHDADTIELSVPDPDHPDVRTMTRIMGVVSTKGKLDHIRTIGLWRLGLPELYVPDIPGPYLDDAMDLVRATAQTLIQDGGVTRRGIVQVDLSKLPASWPRNVSGSGKFVWIARWMRGPIHSNAMIITLSAVGAHDKDPSALTAALHAYAGVARHER